MPGHAISRLSQKSSDIYTLGQYFSVLQDVNMGTAK